MSWGIGEKLKSFWDAAKWPVARTAIDLLSASADALAWELVSNKFGPGVTWWPLYLARMTASASAGAVANASVNFLTNTLAIKLYLGKEISLSRAFVGTVKENFVKRAVQSFVDGFLWKPLVDGGNALTQKITGDPRVDTPWAALSSSSSVFIGTAVSTLATNYFLGLQDSALSSGAAAAGFNVDNFTSWFSASDTIDTGGATACTFGGRLAGELANFGITAMIARCRAADSEEEIPLYDIRRQRGACFDFFSTTVVNRAEETEAFLKQTEALVPTLSPV
ncbi:MAG: hypothetical protein K0S08_2200 [Gammaproteobacteria bacterium]|jgi:hypothetical protein|nr:hypothetical protein [Gammaproteobacteria bacterium]